MKKAFLFLAAFSVVFLTGCGFYKKQIEETISTSFEEQIRNDDRLGEAWIRGGAKVQKVILVQNGLTKYDGMVYVLLHGKIYQVAISVTADGTSTMWKTTDFSPFDFLFQPAKFESEEIVGCGG